MFIYVLIFNAYFEAKPQQHQTPTNYKRTCLNITVAIEHTYHFEAKNIMKNGNL